MNILKIHKKFIAKDIPQPGLIIYLIETDNNNAIESGFVNV